MKLEVAQGNETKCKSPLQDKSPLVEELEDQLLQLYQERSNAFQERRR